MKTKDLLKIVNENKDGRKKYPFDYYERLDFLKYCKKYNYRSKRALGNNGVNWLLIYEHYRRRKLEQPKKFRMIIPPKTFLAMLRYYFSTSNDRKTFFLVRTSAKLRFIKVTDAKKEIKRELSVSQEQKQEG